MAADDEDDDIPAVARPDPAELDYDLDAALSALVCVRAEIAPMPSPRSRSVPSDAAMAWRSARTG